MMTGLVEPSRGTLAYRGVPLRECLDEYKKSLGYVPEQPDVYGFLSVWEYLELISSLRAIPQRTFRRRATELLKGFQLYAARDVPLGSCSKGMRQRAVLISAMIHDPELLVLDEPFSGLDVTSALIVRRVIELLAEAGKGVFFSSPALEQFDRLCTNLIVLRAGEIVAAGTMAEAREGFAELGLEAGFLQLTEELDTDATARGILAATRTP
jgi:ABC-2 type transport system ATP-binding protein